MLGVWWGCGGGSLGEEVGVREEGTLTCAPGHTIDC